MIAIRSSADQFSWLEERGLEKDRTSLELLTDLHLFLLSIREVYLEGFSESDD